jgi:hypothetical protein
VPIFTIQVLLALVTFGLLARWYVAPRLASLPREVALQPLLAVHSIRYVGLVFLAPTVVRPSLSASFAIPAGVGTAIAGVLALAAIGALRARSPIAIPLVWVFSVEGIGDFINAFLQAGLHGAVNDLGAAYYVPIVIVPAALVTHAMIVWLLVKRRLPW